MRRGVERAAWGPSRTLLELARRVGDSGDLGDEHVRWALYQEALRRRLLEPLRDAVEQDPDRVMATGAVLAALELVPASDRSRWVEDTASWDTAEVIARRADELKTLDDVTRTASTDPGDATRPEDGQWRGAIQEWSDWLQLRAAAPASRPEVLDALAEHGGREGSATSRPRRGDLTPD